VGCHTLVWGRFHSSNHITTLILITTLTQHPRHLLAHPIIILIILIRTLIQHPQHLLAHPIIRITILIITPTTLLTTEVEDAKARA
jgi:hypothetical protein